jgi:hypothetical protein
MRRTASLLIVGALSTTCIIETNPGFEGGGEAGSTTVQQGSESGLGVETGEGSTSASSSGTNGSTTSGSTESGETGSGPEGHTLFVSSTIRTGNLGGRRGADAHCAELATAALLAGEWVALLSTSGADAVDAVPIVGPVRNMNGDLMAESGPDLWDGEILNEFAFDEFGRAAGVRGWTGTLADGSSSGDHCEDWSVQSGGAQGTGGNSFTTGSTWINDGASSCAQSFHLLCISVS